MKATFLFISLLLTSPAVAGEVLVPAVYRGAGAEETLWRTEIVVSNVTAGVHALPVRTTIALHRADGQTQSITMPLSPMEVISVPDALRDWFDVENGGGIVRVTWDEESARISARARIYNVGKNGEYGQSVPGLPTAKLESDHFLTGLTGVGGNRTNVGVSNPNAGDTLVWIALYDTSGQARGAFATSIPGRSYRQFNDIFSYFQAGPLNAAMVRVTASEQTVYAYASIVRNDTGDATFVTSH